MKHQILMNVIALTVSLFSIHQLCAQTFTTSSVDGVPIAYEVHGDGTFALVFIHGWSCDKSYWKRQVTPFSQHYKVVLIDLAGHGESGTQRKNYTMESFGADVAAVVNKLNLQHVILIGHSMGGDVIAAATRLLPPNHTAGLVLVDEYKELGAGRTPEEVQAFVNKIRTNFVDSTSRFVRSMFSKNADSALVNWVANDMSSAPPAIALSALEATFNYSREITKTLSQVKAPVVAINSDNEPTDTASMQRFRVETIIIPGLGHFMMMEDAGQFNKVLQSVIEKMTK